MSDPQKKPVIHVLPAIMTGAAALVASLTAVYVNVRGDHKDTPPPAISTPAVPVEAATPKPVPEAPKPPEPVKLRLQLDRIAVKNEGAAMGTADWRFAVEADGQPLFVFSRESMTATGGRNVVVLTESDGADGNVVLDPDAKIPVTIKAWRSGWFKGAEPIATGEGVLTRAGNLAPIEVKAAKDSAGDFTFYFSASPVGN